MSDCRHPLTVTVYSSFDDLPPCYRALDHTARSRSFYFSLAWFRNLAATALAPGHRPRLYGVEESDGDGRALALLPAQAADHGPRVLSGLAGPYTTLFGPLLAADADVTAICGYLAAAIRAERPRWQSLRFDALDPDSDFYGGFAAALRGAGFAVQEFGHFGNWYEAMGTSGADYLAGRPSILRNTIKRKSRKLEKSGTARIDLIVDEDGLEPAIAAYEAVYAASWKDREPHPGFTPGLIRAAVAAGVLRLGVIHVDGEPAAAQIWIVSGGGATIFKLAYDERFKKLSLGSILSHRLMCHVIEKDGVGEVDFGRGDDPYKEQWLALRRERRGLIAHDPKTWRGAMGAAKFAVAGPIKRLTKITGSRR